MPKTTKEERLRWVEPISRKEIRIKNLVKICPYGKRTLERWVACYKEFGEEGLEPKSTRPKTNPNETPIRIKERVIELRKNEEQCAVKIMWDLEEEGIYLHKNTVQKIIKKEGLTRKYRIRKINPNYVRATLKKGELIEIDIKFVPDRIKGQRAYQFTAIDCATRWRYLQAYNNPSNYSAIRFLKEVIKAGGFEIKTVKTDNGACFTNRYTGYSKSSDPFNPRLHEFDILCQKIGIPHYLIDPGKPQQNSFVERSHREDQEKFYEKTQFTSFEDLKYQMRLWNMKYNNTKHCGLNGKTPNQMLKLLN